MPEVRGSKRYIENIVEKRSNSSGAISPLFYNTFYLLLDFHVYARTIFLLRDKRLFEISELFISSESRTCRHADARPDVGPCLA